MNFSDAKIDHSEFCLKSKIIKSSNSCLSPLYSTQSNYVLPLVSKQE